MNRKTFYLLLFDQFDSWCYDWIWIWCTNSPITDPDEITSSNQRHRPINHRRRTIININDTAGGDFGGFGVQLTETISTAKWFWSTIHRNHFFPPPPIVSVQNRMMDRSLVFFTCRKPLSTSNGFEVQLTEIISTTKWFWHNFIQNIL